jgi:hypothetical protein
MIRRLANSLAICVAIAICLVCGVSQAQHSDVLVQQSAQRLVTGKADFDNGLWSLGQRVFSRGFDSDYLVNNPGFDALGSNSAQLPPESQALPPLTLLSWDFLPMQIGGTTSNLLFWNGLDSDGQAGLSPGDVHFGPTPGPGYTLTMFDKNSQPFAIHGSGASFIAGGVITRTDATGFLHQHNYFQLDDGSGYMGTRPADGVYLFALQLRMPGLASSLPFYMLFDTLATSSAALNNAALPWVEQQLDLPGDYNGDGRVDAADYTAWRDILNQTGAGLAADGSGNQIVDVDDYDLWKQHFGTSAALRIAASSPGNAASRLEPSISVPEPTAASVLLVVASLLAISPTRHRRACRAPESAPLQC